MTEITQFISGQALRSGPKGRVSKDAPTSAIAVRVGVVFAGFVGVVHGVKVMAVRQMRVMASLFVISRAMVLRGPTMMLGGGFVVLRSLFVMFGQHACVHDLSSARAGGAPAAR
jgi:hypothetical protein